MFTITLMTLLYINLYSPWVASYTFPNCLHLIQFGTIKSATDCGKSSNTIQVPVLIFNMHKMFTAGFDLVDHFRICVSQMTTAIFQLS